jgi:glycosyltransferase involved in cell wall biosynthesis
MNIFFISDCPYLNTGLARMTRNIIRGLAENGHNVFLGSWGWDINAFPKNIENQWIYEDKKTNNKHIAFPMIKNPEKQLSLSYEIIRQTKPDIVFTLGDYYNFQGFEMLKSKLDYSFKWVAYYTIEASPISSLYRSAFNTIDEIFVPSKFGQNVISESFGIDSHYVPFGIDHESFYKLDNELIRIERKKRNLDGKIRFISVCKNQHRKNIPAFLQALKSANEKNKDIVGYLHCNIDKFTGNQIDVKKIIERLDISEEVLQLPSKNISLTLGTNDSDLNVEYNCSNYLVNSSVAEGFGLPIVEGMACGLTPIATNCSAMKELVKKTGFGVGFNNFLDPLEQEIGIIDSKKLSKTFLRVAEKDFYSSRIESNLKYAKGFTSENMNIKINSIVSEISENTILPVESI